jgi:hypothetical protein
MWCDVPNWWDWHASAQQKLEAQIAKNIFTSAKKRTIGGKKVKEEEQIKP